MDVLSSGLKTTLFFFFFKLIELNMCLAHLRVYEAKSLSE